MQGFVAGAAVIGAPCYMIYETARHKLEMDTETAVTRYKLEMDKEIEGLRFINDEAKEIVRKRAENFQNAMTLLATAANKRSSPRNTDEV